MSSGNYVVSQNTTLGVVSVVAMCGLVVRRYGQDSHASDVGQTKCPKIFAVTNKDNVLTADEGNERILSINTSTGCVQELALSVKGGMHGPRGLCLDESRGRLYVGDRVFSVAGGIHNARALCKLIISILYR